MIDQPFAVAAQQGREDRSYRRCNFVATRRGERSEVVPPDKSLSGLAHRRLVKRVRMMVDVAGNEGRADSVPPDPILVEFAASRVAGVELPGCLFERDNPNRFREQAVHRTEEITGGNGVGERERSNLAQRMNTGVGPSGALHIDRDAFDLGERVLQDALNGGAIRLDLPAVEVRAIVCESRFEMAHPKSAEV